MTLAPPDSLYKFVTPDAALKSLSAGTLRWSSPELFDEPWRVRLEPQLGFDHLAVGKAMIKAAAGLIFARDLPPPGNPDHLLYKAIRRWRSDERFRDESEAQEALSELLASTPETVRGKLQKMLAVWRNLVEHARVLCLADSHKNLTNWRLYADNHRGAVLRFRGDGFLKGAAKVEYTMARPNLTTIKEQVDELIGVSNATPPDAYPHKLFVKPRQDAAEKEWRCLRVMQEEDLDCGEDVEDWYQDDPFPGEELEAVYLGFLMPAQTRDEIVALVRRKYPKATLYSAQAVDNLCELDFVKLS